MISPARIHGLFPLVGVHLQQAAEAPRAPWSVRHAVALVQNSRIHRKVGQRPTKGSVVTILKASPDEGTFRPPCGCILSSGPAWQPFHRRNIQRRRQVVTTASEHMLNTLVLEGRSADHRKNRLNAMVAFRIPANQLFLGQIIVSFKVFLVQRVRLGNRRNQPLAMARAFSKLGRNLRKLWWAAPRPSHPAKGLPS